MTRRGILSALLLQTVGYGNQLNTSGTVKFIAPVNPIPLTLDITQLKSLTVRNGDHEVTVTREDIMDALKSEIPR